MEAMSLQDMDCRADMEAAPQEDMEAHQAVDMEAHRAATQEDGKHLPAQAMAGNQSLDAALLAFSKLITENCNLNFRNLPQELLSF
jgi:hypothetical protein